MQVWLMMADAGPEDCSAAQHYATRLWRDVQAKTKKGFGGLESLPFVAQGRWSAPAFDPGATASSASSVVGLGEDSGNCMSLHLIAWAAVSHMDRSVSLLSDHKSTDSGMWSCLNLARVCESG